MRITVRYTQRWGKTLSASACILRMHERVQSTMAQGSNLARRTLDAAERPSMYAHEGGWRGTDRRAVRVARLARRLRNVLDRMLDQRRRAQVEQLAGFAAGEYSRDLARLAVAAMPQCGPAFHLEGVALECDEWPALERAGYIRIERPVTSTGSLSGEAWSAEVTEQGRELLDLHERIAFASSELGLPKYAIDIKYSEGAKGGPGWVARYHASAVRGRGTVPVEGYSRRMPEDAARELVTNYRAASESGKIKGAAA